MMKWLLAVIVVSLTVLSLLRTDEDKGAVHTAGAMPFTESNQETHWLKAFHSVASERGMTVRLYPGGALGKEIERSEQTSLNLLQVNLTSGDDVLQYSPYLRTLRLPFFLRDIAQLDCMVSNPEFLDLVNRDTIPRGIRVMDVLVMGAPAGLFLNEGEAGQAIQLDGRRIRAMDRMQIDVIEAWGASPVQVPWPEIQTALQTGIADGYINPPGVALQFRHERMLDTFVRLEVFMGFRFVTVSADWYDELSAAERATIREALAAARTDNRNRLDTIEARDLVELESRNIRVTHVAEDEMKAMIERAIEATSDVVPDDVLTHAITMREELCSP